MRFFLGITLITLASSCTSPKPAFKKESVCTSQAIKHLKNPRYAERKVIHSKELSMALSKTTQLMQNCYDDFKLRSEKHEFNTCLVVGVDETGKMDFHNFGSREVALDNEFIDCANNITKQINYGAFGKNYILLQSYQFYVDGSI